MSACPLERGSSGVGAMMWGVGKGKGLDIGIWQDLIKGRLLYRVVMLD